MRSPTRRSVFFLASYAVILGLVPRALGHGDDMEGMDMSPPANQPPPDDGGYPPTYFAHPEHRGLIFAHIALMVASWIFMLPVGESTDP